jgi:hypothetical protein
LLFPPHSSRDIEDHRRSRRGDSGGERRPASYDLYQLVATQGSRFGAWAIAHGLQLNQVRAPGLCTQVFGEGTARTSAKPCARLKDAPALYVSAGRHEVMQIDRVPVDRLQSVMQPSGDRRHTSPKAKSLRYQCDPAMPSWLRSRHLLTGADAS